MTGAGAPGEHEPGAQVSPQWAAWRRSIDLDEYEARFVGTGAHGEADLIASLGGRAVLDAGCGTGRVAIELARRGFDVAGVDLDDDMIEVARRHAPEVPWFVADLARFDLGRTFDQDSSLTVGPGWDDVTGLGSPNAGWLTATG